MKTLVELVIYFLVLALLCMNHFPIFSRLTVIRRNLDYIIVHVNSHVKT